MTDSQAQLSAALAGRYLLERELGRGGMATVYLAQDVRHARRVALKVLHPELAASLGPERFLREIRTTARLQHPHILPVFDSGNTAGQIWYTMPFVAGETLREKLRREIQLPVDEALRITRDLAFALDYAHRHGVVHRDVKPENILLADGQALVADFGVAKAVEQGSEGRLTDTGLAIGTVAYMSPEQAAGERQLDGRSDVYSLGCVLYELLSGEPPFTGRTPQAIIAKRVLEPVPHVRTLRESVPVTVEQALTRALAKAPADRFATAADFARVLGDSLEVREGSPSHTETIATARKRRGPGQLRLAAMATLSLVVFAGIVLLRSTPSSSSLDANLLAVAPFDVLDPELQLWREGLVDLLSRNLDGAGPLRSVPPTTVIRRWRGRGDPPSAIRLGQRTGAQLTVFGNLVPAGRDSVRLRAILFDVANEKALAEVELRDASSGVDRLSDSLTARLLAALARHRRIELTHIASLGSTSPPALKAFLRGEQWFRRGAWDSAVHAYHEAVAADNNFALAYWRLFRVTAWQRSRGDTLARAYARRAGALNRGLAPRDSLLVAIDAEFEPVDLARPERYRRLLAAATDAVRRYPDDVDAWHTLGEVYYHVGLQYQTSLDTALAAFERAIALDSAYAPAYIHAMELASWVNRLADAKQYAKEYLRRAPDDVTASGIRLALTLVDQEAQSDEAQLALRKASANVLWHAWQVFFGAVDSTEVALDIARALAATPQTDIPWLPADARRAILLASLSYRGRLDEASSVWDMDVARPAAFLAELCILGRPLPRGGEVLLQQGPRGRSLQDLHDGLPCWTRQGDSASIRTYARLTDSLSRAGADSSVRALAAYGQTAAAAYLALTRGDSTGALKYFSALPDGACPECYERLAMLLVRSARGDHRSVRDDAGPWTYSPNAGYVMGMLAHARAAERLADREPAVRGYQHVVDAWRMADEELQPYVAEARAALERLTAESPR